MRTRFGALCTGKTCRFRIWADPDRRLELCLAGRNIEVPYEGRPVREVVVDGVEPGIRYSYRIDGAGPFPDPASRWQPEGPHGWSAVVDPDLFRWSDESFRIPALADLVIYELHVGTFTQEGTFRSLTEKLSYLRDLGITAVELMPLAECPGRWNWGYDGVGLYAPYHSYGEPDDLRRLVDRAHAMGLAVLLDVVYNHLGPDGAYHCLYSKHYRSPHHQTPWGDGLNFDNTLSEHLRGFFLGSAFHWLEEYHVDGFRLDAVHAIEDESPVHFLQEFTEAVHKTRPGALVIAEDNRNDARLVRPAAEGGYGMDAVWSDDWHHQMRRRLAGDHHGYYSDYRGSLEDIVTTTQRGWFFTGQHSDFRAAPRGTPADGIPRQRMVIFLQNHDQIGNRAFGGRLHHQIQEEEWLAASALLVLAPETPLLFMGQEWAATTPFLYFTDHNEELGRLVCEGRRREFADFPEFAAGESRSAIPDPQAADTFERSKLNWRELDTPLGGGCLAWYRDLLQFRRRYGAAQDVSLENAGVILLRWPRGALSAVRFDAGPACLRLAPGLQTAGQRGKIELQGDTLIFDGAGAILLQVEEA